MEAGPEGEGQVGRCLEGGARCPAWAPARWRTGEVEPGWGVWTVRSSAAEPPD